MDKFIQWLQDAYQSLVDFKENILRSFFQLRIVAPIFRYITPNDLCYLRIMAAIVILFLYLRGYYIWLLPLFIAAVLLDFIDGPLARATNQITEEGKKLDPIADKVLISIPLLVIGIDKFDMLTVLMFLLVEGLLALLANYLKPYLKDRFNIPLMSGANAFGQIKMFCQTFAIGILLYNPNSERIVLVSETMIWVAIGFGIGSFLRHLARMSQPVEPSKRIITIPNLITLSGIFLFIPAGVALVREQWVAATVMIVWIFASDWLDGWIARRYNQETSFGAAIDPLRDHIARFLVALWLFIRLDDHILQLMIVALVAMEFSIGIICMYMAKRYKTVRLVNRWGKIRAGVHYTLLAIPFFHCIGIYTLPHIWLALTFAVMIIFSIIALVSYLGQRVNFVVEGVQKNAGNLNRRE